MAVFSRLANNSPVKGSQLKQVKANSQKSKPRYLQQGFTDLTWWWKTISWLFRSEPTLTDRAVMLAVDAATLIRDAVKELFRRMEGFFVDVKDAAVRYANVLVTLIVSFVRQFKKSFNQTVLFFREAFKVTKDKEGLAAVNELQRANEARRKARASSVQPIPPFKGKGKGKAKGNFVAQSSDDDDDGCDFYIFKFLTTFVTKLTAFFDMLPKMDLSLSKLNASLTLLSHCDRFDLIGKSKWLLNVIYSAITGKELFEDVSMATNFTKYVTSLNAKLSSLEELRNPTLDSLIGLRRDEKEMTKCYTYLISAFPKRANNYTTVYNHAVKRCAQFAGSVQGMQGRIKPVTLSLSGPAGCGKTTVQRSLEKDIMSVVSSLLADSTDDDVRIFAEHATRPASFSRNCVESTPEYDDGYCNPMFYVLEEYLTLKDKKISVEWAAKMLRYADSGPLLLNFAFGAKGTKYFDSPFVIATGNFPSGHVVPFNDPVAFFRRLDFDLCVRSTAGVDKFDMRKHVVFKMSEKNIDAHKKYYINRAFQKFKEVYPDTAPAIEDEFGYDQLVMLMVFCYLERIAPENSPQSPTGAFDEISKLYDPKEITNQMKISRASGATFFGSEGAYVTDKTVKPQPEPLGTDEDSDTEITGSFESAESDHSDDESSDDSSVIELQDGAGGLVEVSSESDDGAGAFLAHSNQGRQPLRRNSKPHALVVKFVDFLTSCNAPIASGSIEAMRSELKTIRESLVALFTGDFKYTGNFLSSTSNRYGLYATFMFKFIGYKKLFTPLRNNSSSSNVSNVLKAVRMLYASCRDLEDLLTRTSPNSYEQELRPSGPIQLREAYATTMTSAQRTYIRSIVKFKLAVSKKGELANIARIKQRDLWLTKRRKKNKVRQQAQTARKQAARDALRRDINGARNSRADTRQFEIEIHRRQDFGFDWADSDEDYEGYEDHDISDLYAPTESMDQDETDSRNVRVGQDRRRYFAQVFHDLGPEVTTCVPKERMGYYAAAFEYVSFFNISWLAPTESGFFAHGITTMTERSHFLSLFSHYVFRRKLLRFFSHTIFNVAVRISQENDVSFLQDLMSDLVDCTNIGQIMVVLYEVAFSRQYSSLTDSIKNRGNALDFFVHEYVKNSDAKRPDMQNLMKRCDMLSLDIGTYVFFFQTYFTRRFFPHNGKAVTDFVESIGESVVDDKDFLGALKLLGVGIAFSLAIAYVVKSLGRSSEVDEASDLVSNLNAEELVQLEELIEEYKAQSLDSKKPMTKPAKRGNIAHKFQKKYAAHSGTSHAIRNIIMKNCYACLSGPNNNVFGTLTFLGGQVAMMNKHVFEAITSFYLLPYAPKLNSNGVLQFPKSEAKIIREFPASDTVIITLGSVARSHARLYKFLMTRAEYSTQFVSEGCVISYDDNDTLAGTFDPISDVVFKKDKPIHIQRSALSPATMTIDKKIAYTWSGAKPGACGSVVMGAFKGTQKIIGIHAAGLPKTHHGLCVPVVYEDIIDIFTETTPESQFLCQNGENICFEDEDPILGAYSITPDSITTPIHTNPSNATVFVKTPFAEEEFMGGPPGRPADLTKEAYITNLVKEQESTKVFKPHDDVYDIAHEFHEDIAALFTQTDPSLIRGCRTLTNDEAMYGYHNLDSFDWSSAEGINLKILGVKKKHLCDPESQAAEIVRNHVDESIRLKDEEGIYNYQINTDSLKDEIRDHARVDAKKTRVFNVTDTINNIEIKRSIGDLVSKTKEGFMLGPAMCGINPTSMCWTMLYNLFQGDNVVFTDVSGFDLACIMWVMIIIAPWLRVAYGHNRRAYKRALWCVLSCILGLRFAFGRGRLLCRGNTSGNWITTFLNTIVNTCFHGVAVVYLAKENGDDPRKCLHALKLALYSDDNISQLPYPWWNTANVVRAFRVLFNITLTDVNKGTIGNDLSLYTIDQAEFLSRRFVKRDGVVYAPLGIDSLISQLYWVRLPRGSPDSHLYAQLQQNIDNVLRELCEFPQDEAYIWCKRISDFIDEHDIPCVVRPFEYYRGIELKFEYA